MEVILLERIDRLGEMGEVVKVKPGFARNYLLPQNKALRATPENKTYFEAQKVDLEAANQERRNEAEKTAEQLDGLVLKLIRQAGDSGQLYGSVTGRDVTSELREQDHPVEKGMVMINQPIKEIGVHPVRVALHPEVSITINVNVARTDDEAEFQAELHAKGQDIVAEDVAEAAVAPADEPAIAVEEVFDEGVDAAEEVAAAAEEAEQVIAEIAEEEAAAETGQGGADDAASTDEESAEEEPAGDDDKPG